MRSSVKGSAFEWYAALMITLAGSRIYTSMADTDDVIDEALNGFEDVLSSVEGVS